MFVGVGLGGVNPHTIPGDEAEGVIDAVNYIHDLRQADQMSQLLVGDKVVVIGGGMTAIDIAVQSKKLGASEVTIAYRRNKANMNASLHEQHFAQINDVKLRYCSSPIKVLSKYGHVTGVEFNVTALDQNGNIEKTEKSYQLETDVIFKAIGQTLIEDQLGDSANSLNIEKGRVIISDERKTSLDNVWAGGDCVAGGENLTVSAVQDGKLAALSIHDYLKNS